MMRRSSKNPPSWQAVEQRLATYDQAALIALLERLFQQSREAQTVLATEVLGLPDNRAELTAYRQQIITTFYPAGGPSWEYGLDLPGAQRLIETYRQTTTDTLGTIELMLTFVETGTRFTNDFGDIEEVFYVTLEAMLADLVDLLQTPMGRPFYPQVRDRLTHLVQQAEWIGWGYGDAVRDLVNDLWAAMDDLPEGSDSTSRGTG